MVRAMGELSSAASPSMALLAALYARPAAAAPNAAQTQAAVKAEGGSAAAAAIKVEAQKDPSIKQEAAWAEGLKEEAGHHQQQPAGTDEHKLAAHLPLLWRYLRHPLTSVRLAVAQCLQRLAGSGGGGTAWLQPVLGPTLQLLFQSLVMETDSRVRAQSLTAWHALVRAAGGAAAASALSPADIAAAAALAATQIGAAPDQQLLVAPDGAGGVGPLKGVAPMAAPPRSPSKVGRGAASPSPPPKRRRGAKKGVAYADDPNEEDGFDSDEGDALGGGNRGGRCGAWQGVGRGRVRV
jgi:hypothetical protein